MTGGLNGGRAKGGKARVAKMSAAERTAFARSGAKARWTGGKKVSEKMWAYIEGGKFPFTPSKTRRDVCELIEADEVEAIITGKGRIVQVLVTEL